MTRALFRTLLLLQPREFRGRFAAEILWVYDQAAGDAKTSGFCVDAAFSLLRRWLRQPMLWCVAGGTAGGLLNLAWGTAVVATMRPSVRLAEAPLDTLLVATLGAVFALTFILAVTVLLFHSLRRRRIP